MFICIHPQALCLQQHTYVLVIYNVDINGITIYMT